MWQRPFSIVAKLLDSRGLGFKSFSPFDSGKIKEPRRGVKGCRIRCGIGQNGIRANTGKSNQAMSDDANLIWYRGAIGACMSGGRSPLPPLPPLPPVSTDRRLPASYHGQGISGRTITSQFHPASGFHWKPVEGTGAKRGYSGLQEIGRRIVFFLRIQSQGQEKLNTDKGNLGQN